MDVVDLVFGAGAEALPELEERPGPEEKRMVEVLDIYVEWDDGAKGKPLCMRSLCVKGEGHVGACRKAK